MPTFVKVFRLQNKLYEFRTHTQTNLKSIFIKEDLKISNTQIRHWFSMINSINTHLRQHFPLTQHKYLTLKSINWIHQTISESTS